MDNYVINVVMISRKSKSIIQFLLSRCNPANWPNSCNVVFAFYHYTLQPLKMNKKGIPTLYVTDRRGRADHTKYIQSRLGSLTESIKPYPSVRLSICSNVEISAIIKAKVTKFVMKLPLYQTQIKCILNIGCHAHCLRKSIKQFFYLI